jgi:hypothetical protein
VNGVFQRDEPGGFRWRKVFHAVPLPWLVLTATVRNTGTGLPSPGGTSGGTSGGSGMLLVIAAA